MEQIVITVATEIDFKEVSTYVKRAYGQKFGTEPEDPHVYIVARRGSMIIGTAGIELPDGSGMLPMQHIREFKKDSELPVDSCVQLGRWSAHEQSVSLPLVYAVCMYARKYYDKEYALIEQSDGANKILRKRGIVFLPIACGDVRPDKVPKNDFLFYQKFSPRPYLMKLSQAMDALSELSLPAVRIAF